MKRNYCEYAPIDSHPATMRQTCRSTFRSDCKRKDCTNAHFEPDIRPYTNARLGHCAYLSGCYAFYNVAVPEYARVEDESMPSGLGGGDGRARKVCRFLHFKLEQDNVDTVDSVDTVDNDNTVHVDSANDNTINNNNTDKNNTASNTNTVDPIDALAEQMQKSSISSAFPAQTIQANILTINPTVLLQRGPFHILLLDPPWAISQRLPYSTISDQAMLTLPLHPLQTEGGILALWVTARAMDLGRRCILQWGYRLVDEVVWVKVNQLGRMIRTGRTGHWLNHTKEHLLIAIKTSRPVTKDSLPPWINIGTDTDVIVAEPRGTSRKPDETYAILERLVPNGRRLELFGREHNARPGWLTMGDQVNDKIYDPLLHAALHQIGRTDVQLST